MKLSKDIDVLIVTDDEVIQSFYEAILKPKDILSRKCDSKTFFGLTLPQIPSLIIFHLEPEFWDEVFEFLMEMRQTLDKKDQPLVLLVTPRDWLDSAFDDLVNGCLVSPIVPDDFLAKVEELLQRNIETTNSI